MSLGNQLVVFRLDHGRYALPLAVVDHVVRAVEVTALPNAPAIVHGAIDVHGRLLPVLNVRSRFHLPEREIRPADWFLLARTERRAVALVVDDSEGVVESSADDIVASARIVPGLDMFPGVVGLKDGLVLIHDLETFLSLDDARVLDEALSGPPI